MEYYESVPSEFEDEVSIPSKWSVGGPCPNCAADGQHGVLLFVDMGDDIETAHTVSDWETADSVRFEIRCSEYEYGTQGCDFEYALRTISATVAEDWDNPY